MNYKELANDIVKHVGGAGNIEMVSHCMTRLRFHLKDVEKVDETGLKELKGVLGVVYSGGQYMVILGQNLLPVYERVVKDFDLTADAAIDENPDGKSAKKPLTIKTAANNVLSYVSSAITPLVPGLIAGGMLKVVLLLIVTFISSDFSESSTYLLLSAIADAPFYFMPIVVAYGAAAKLGGTPVYSMIAAAALFHDNFIGLVDSGEAFSLFGIAVQPLKYGSTLLPALLIALVAYYAEKLLNKIIPGMIRPIFVGMGTILISGSLGYLILGPAGNIAGEVIAAVFMFLSRTVGPLAVGLLAGFMPWLVMTGMHRTITPFMPQLINNPGFDTIIRPSLILHNVSEGGAVIGVAIRSKDSNYRTECISLAISCIVAGVTEPALYGVNLKHRKPMYGVMAGGFAGGFVASLLGAKAYLMGYSNILALPIFKETALAMVVAILVSIAVSCIVTVILGIDEKKQGELTRPSEKAYEDKDIVSINDGQMIRIESVQDEAFSSKALGDGVAFILESDQITSPVNGVISAVFPTGHAIGITTNEGVEIIIHIGINTVNLNGEGFEVLVKEGEQVKAGAPLVNVERQRIEKKGYDLTTMLIITNANGKDIAFHGYGNVKRGEILN